MPPPAKNVRVTLSGKVTAVLNVAVTARAVVIDTVQAPVPVQAPLQPANIEPGADVAVSVTVLPIPKIALHVVPQLMPAGSDVTVPLKAPVPAFVTVSGNTRSSSA